MMSEKTLLKAMPWLVTLGLLLLWEAVCVVTGIEPFILPRPTLVFETSVKFAPQLLHHSLQTFYTTLAGFVIGVIGGALLGVAIGASQFVYNGDRKSTRLNSSH